MDIHAPEDANEGATEARFRIARELAALGDTREAILLYRKILDTDRHHFRALNNLGSLLENEGSLDEALQLYQTADRARPGEAPILHNIAHVLYQMGRQSDSIAAWQALIELDPSNAQAPYCIGNVHMDRRDFVRAAISYMAAADLDPEFHQAYSNLGQALLEAGQVIGAEAAFARAVALHPNDADWFNLAKVQDLLAKNEEAAASYRAVIDAQPDSALARERLIYLLGRCGQDEEAGSLARDWLNHTPDHPVARHVYEIYHGDGAAGASAAYVRTVFDGFADVFERSLARLDYRAPALVGEALKSRLAPDVVDRAIVDAGCGTGLCAPWLRPHAARLVGVDLSPGMLSRAKAKNTYDELHEADLTAFLVSQPCAFDVLVACDTLNYFGPLEAVFASAHQALRAGGLLIFTVECGDHTTAFQLQKHGRYTHQKGLLLALLADSGFSDIQAEPVQLRTESGQAVAGLLVTCLNGSTNRSTR